LAKRATPSGSRQTARPPSENQPRTQGTKLAADLANRITKEIADDKLEDGTVLASEPELLERYGVSRAVFREAVRLLESRQVARMRRGPGGGLVVTTPTIESIIDPAAVYLFFANTKVTDVSAARLILEESVANLVPSRVTEADVAQLRSLAESERDGTVADLRELHSLLAAMTKNPVLEVFVGLLTRLSFLYFPDPRRIMPSTRDESNTAHVAIIDAIIAGDAGLTMHRMRQHLEAEAKYLHRKVQARQLLDTSVLRELDDQTKRGERVAREIFVGIVDSGWPVGRLLGSEAEMMARYGVSRAVLREAVRQLEHLQVAQMRRGPGGGLFVTEPGIDSTVAALSTLLDRRTIQAADLFEVRIAIELAIVGLVVEDLDDGGEAVLRKQLEAEASHADADGFEERGHDLHHVLAGMVRNPVLGLLSLVLVRLTQMHQGSPPADFERFKPFIDEAVRVHAGIVGAMSARDGELARFRMRRHLEVLQGFYR
jgi:DNA-binding FadR family transcriptional regulator